MKSGYRKSSRYTCVTPLLHLNLTFNYLILKNIFIFVTLVTLFEIPYIKVCGICEPHIHDIYEKFLHNRGGILKSVTSVISVTN